jgi:hypothetical protein
MTKEEIRELILKTFPKLNSDKIFKITSKKDTKYNCIAWAAIYDDRNLWPPGGVDLDGVIFVWPDDLPNDESLDAFIKLYNKYGYEVCENTDFEEGFRKIAIYLNTKTKKCTHAARQRTNGEWTSKLGHEQDIAHSDPYSLESEKYGMVAAIMRKKY